MVSACTAPVRRLFGPIPQDSRAILEAATWRLVPSDEHPGAREAHVIGYIDKALSLPFYALAKPACWSHRRELERGAKLLESVALRDWGSPFVALASSQQDAVLGYVQGQDLEFFHTLLVLSLEGFLGDPVHGGNRGQAGWQAIGYVPGQPRPGSCGHPAKSHR